MCTAAAPASTFATTQRRRPIAGGGGRSEAIYERGVCVYGEVRGDGIGETIGGGERVEDFDGEGDHEAFIIWQRNRVQGFF